MARFLGFILDFFLGFRVCSGEVFRVYVAIFFRV